MPSWLLKAAAQGAISLLPGRHRVNRLLQERVTASLVLTKPRFEAKLGQCHHHLTSFERVQGAGARAQSALELGTGWYPIVPIGLALAGVSSVTTVDVSPLLDSARIARVVELYANELAEGSLAGALPGLDVSRARALLAAALERAGGTAQAMLAALGVHSVVGELVDLGLPSDSVDLLVSNNTLEHIPDKPLQAILAALARLGAPGAVADHFIDLSDHYAHFDGSISEFNYLRYSPALWRLFNNRLHYQNRLRASDYRRLFERAGFQVVAEEGQSGATSELVGLKLAPHFRHYAQADLLVARMWLTAVAPR